ncbi:hypothetical protein CPter91_4387 [Collimonas pratensis]|uniref:Uncharacterized protein n=1 Tax=Collimonas pratensis TaxID=279113 RepID=A0A127Q9G4_9BURK|nr:hypothetical protein CPter91_4387 [Collimonas pratensis]
MTFHIMKICCIARQIFKKISVRKVMSLVYKQNMQTYSYGAAQQ